VLPFSSRTEFLAKCPDPGSHVDVVALGIGAASVTDQRIQDDVRELRHRMADVPLVPIPDHAEPLPGIEALLHGIGGYIPTTLGPSVVFQALHLIHAGGTFVPADVLLQETGDHIRPAPANAPALVANGLTDRQANVLELIRQGKSNKLIAASLDISENTVKVYVHQIMKRLGAMNRTHACFLLSQPDPNADD
jgi:DNA-binding NarL/FixJ family response regulator